jgi:hypothetical protein
MTLHIRWKETSVQLDGNARGKCILSTKCNSPKHIPVCGQRRYASNFHALEAVNESLKTNLLLWTRWCKFVFKHASNSTTQNYYWISLSIQWPFLCYLFMHNTFSGNGPTQWQIMSVGTKNHLLRGYQKYSNFILITSEKNQRHEVWYQMCVNEIG